MGRTIKILIAICVIIVGGVFYKNSSIEKNIASELDKLSSDDFFKYSKVECKGVFDTDCTIKKVTLIVQTKKSEDEVTLDFIKIYSVQNYFDMEQKFQNRDIAMRADFVGFDMEKKNFILGIKDKFLLELMDGLYNSLNKFSVHSEFVVNFKAKDNLHIVENRVEDEIMLNKFEIKKLQVKAKNASIDGKVLVENLDFSDFQNSIVKNFSFVIKNNNMESIFIKWLDTLKKDYPKEYREACKVVKLDPNAKPIRVFSKLRKKFADKIDIENSKFKYQKDYNLALKSLITGDKKEIAVVFRNKTNISVADFLKGVMVSIFTKKDVNKYMSDNINLRVEAE